MSESAEWRKYERRIDQERRDNLRHKELISWAEKTSARLAYERRKAEWRKRTAK